MARGGICRSRTCQRSADRKMSISVPQFQNCRIFSRCFYLLVSYKACGCLFREAAPTPRPAFCIEPIFCRLHGPALFRRTPSCCGSESDSEWIRTPRTSGSLQALYQTPLPPRNGALSVTGGCRHGRTREAASPPLTKNMSWRTPARSTVVTKHTDTHILNRNLTKRWI